MTFALQAKGIRKSFGGVEVLHGVDLEAAGGSVLALLGENGAGKSTLVKIIAGDYTPDGGEILVDEVAYPSLTPITARDLGVAIAQSLRARGLGRGPPPRQTDPQGTRCRYRAQ